MLKWTSSVENGDDSSPVVTSGGVFVSYACPQTYDFDPTNGKTIWHYSGPCEGGGGSTPVVLSGLLFVGDSQESAYNGLVLNAKKGNVAGSFNAAFSPAFAHNLGFFVNYTTLEAQGIPKLKQVWSVKLPSSDSYNSQALVVGNIVYLATYANKLVGYDVFNGKQKVQMKLSKNGFYRHAGAGLAYGDGELIVPNGKYSIGFKGS